MYGKKEMTDESGTYLPDEEFNDQIMYIDKVSLLSYLSK
jgi:hypothetical protein